MKIKDKSPLPDVSYYLNLPLKEAKRRFEVAYLAAQFARFHRNAVETAKFIGISRSSFYRKLSTS